MVPSEDHSHDSISGLGWAHFYTYWGHRSIDSSESVHKLAFPSRWADAAAPQRLDRAPLPQAEAGAQVGLLAWHLAGAAVMGKSCLFKALSLLPGPLTRLPMPCSWNSFLFVPQFLKLII